METGCFSILWLSAGGFIPRYGAETFRPASRQGINPQAESESSLKAAKTLSAKEFLPKKATHCGRVGEAQRNPPFQADMERPEAMYASHKRTS